MITTFKPKSKTLEKYIDFFYVFGHSNLKGVSYIAFPHTNTGLSFFKNAQIQRSQNQLTIQPADQKQDVVCIEILGKYVNPVFVNYSGSIDEVAIVFKPLGINHFLKGSLNKLAPSYSQDFTDKAWVNFGSVLFGENSPALRIQALENFLTGQLQNMDLTLMYEALNYLEQMENEYSVEHIALLLNMNLKTLQRHFLNT